MADFPVMPLLWGILRMIPDLPPAPAIIIPAPNGSWQIHSGNTVLQVIPQPNGVYIVQPLTLPPPPLYLPAPLPQTMETPR